MLTKVGGGSVNLDNRREFFPTIANNSSDAEHDLDIGAARIWVSDGSTEKLVDFTAATKQIDAAWAAGDDAGGLDTGTVANSTWYYIWAIYNPTTEAADYLLSASATSPTMPGGYVYKRRIPKQGALLTNGSGNILACTWHGEYATFAVGIINLSIGSGFVTAATVSAPPEWGWIGLHGFQSSVAPQYFAVSGGGVTIPGRATITTATSFSFSPGTIKTDSSSRVSILTTNATVQTLSTNGFME
jgi:hypothetical protein